MDPITALKFALLAFNGIVGAIGTLKAGKPVINPDGSVDVQLTVSISKGKLVKALAQEQADSVLNRAEIEKANRPGGE